MRKTLQLKQRSLLQDADALINGQRQQDYGSPASNFTHIAMIWSALLAKKLNAHITAQEVTMLMVGLKQARAINQPEHIDSWVDMAGYVGCGGELVPRGLATEDLEGLLGEK